MVVPGGVRVWGLGFWIPSDRADVLLDFARL